MKAPQSETLRNYKYTLAMPHASQAHNSANSANSATLPVPRTHQAPSAAFTELDLYCHEILVCQGCVFAPAHPGQLSLYLCPHCAGPATLERRLVTLQRDQ